MHFTYLKQALDLAQIRQGFCAPNPAVGAVVVKADRVLATGYHWGSGCPHAEVEALNQLTDEDVLGATIYVTLEPCCHWGKTPPCTELLIRRGIRRVIYGFRDPNPLVAGQSDQQLHAAGIECIFIPLPEITTFYTSYCYWWQHRKPWVVAKLALSIDGKIAGKAGAPIAITGPDLQQWTHRGRKAADAILTTSKTIIQDDPQLNVRFDGTVYNKPVYILDSQLNLPPTARVLTTADNITVFHHKTADSHRMLALQQRGVVCVAVDHDEQGLSWQPVLDYIGAEGRHVLWVEAGGRCFQSLSQTGFLQRAFIYIAPTCLGIDAQSAFTSTQDILANAKQCAWTVVGRDVVCQIDWW